MIPSFASDLSRHGDRIALILPDLAPVSYRALARQAEAVADNLPRAKRVVAVEAAPSLRFIAAYLGALAGGHAVALLPEGDVAAMSGFCERFAPDAILRAQDKSWVASGAAGAPQPHPDLALLLMTSGSTGHGKAVRLSGRAVGANAGSIADYLGLQPRERAALILPLHYSYGLSVLNSHLAVGASLWLHQGSVLSPGFVDDLRRAACTSLAGVPYSYELLERLDFRAAELPRLRTMTVAGGALPAATVRRYHAHLAARGGRFFVMYGQTEATARMAFLPPDLAGELPDRIGVAIPGGALALRAEDGRTVTATETEGELVYRGPNVMMGYAACRADLARPPEVHELATGDLAVRDARGLYRIVGRRSRMSKIAGLRIDHHALEAALAERGVTAAVFGDDRRLTAACVTPADPVEVAAMMARASGLTCRHVAALPVATLPRLASGKVDYPALAALPAPDRAAGDVAEAFRQCFHPVRVAPSDSFAALGGDSLRHVELAMELERHLGRAPAGWERMSLAQLSRLRPDPRARDGIGSDLLVRALAILAVVVQHQTGWPVYGGSAAMVVLIGYGLGRFQREMLASGDFAGFFRPIKRVLVPYYLILCAYSVAWGQVPWASVALVGNFGLVDPFDHHMLPYLYWFVEVYVQMLLVIAALFLAPPVRDFARRTPFGFGLALLAAAMLLRVAGPALWPIGARQIFTLPWVFYLCALGWCVATADTPGRRLAVLAAAALVMPLVAWLGGNWFGSWIKFGLQFVVVTTLLYAPFVWLPHWLARMVLWVAQASLLIYLLHRFVPELLLSPSVNEIPPVLFDALAVAGGIGLGIAGFVLQRWIQRRGSAFRPGFLRTA